MEGVRSCGHRGPRNSSRRSAVRGPRMHTRPGSTNGAKRARDLARRLRATFPRTLMGRILGQAGVHRVTVTIQASDGALFARNCGHWYPLRH